MTSKPEHTRPFNLEHAKAGAPFSSRNHGPVEIFQWDGKRNKNGVAQPIVGIFTNSGVPNTWTVDGAHTFATPPDDQDFDLVMLPLGYVEGKPFFCGDTIVGNTGEEFTAEPSDADGTHETWAWPKPAPEYPQTKMTDEQLLHAWTDGRFAGLTPLPFDWSARLLANAAIARAIEDGQVYPADKLLHIVGVKVAGVLGTFTVTRLAGDGDKIIAHIDLPGRLKPLAEQDMVPAAMLEKVAIRVWEYLRNVPEIRRASVMPETLAGLVASVKEGK